ncbi:MAG: hypothetical protein FJZ43_04935 [Candidatus Staskawiczbacteria bacterium]|nr:hypothetical protein [Candidatus Staskawiczbacteria bacterium]
MKHTKEQLEKSVKESYSLSVIAIKLGLKPSVNNRANIRKLISKWNIDVSHFGKEKYTKELLSKVVASCQSMAQVLKALGCRRGGGTYEYIKRKIKNLGIDTSHFTGKKTNSGRNHNGNKGRCWEDVLVHQKEKKCKETAYTLRKALIASGREYKCEIIGCTVKDNWCGSPIKLHIHHKDRNWLNNTKENLEFRCPNCNSQTNNCCVGNRSKINGK